MSDFFLPDCATEAWLTERWETAKPHDKALLIAVRQFGCRLVSLSEDAKNFRIPLDRPVIVVIYNRLYNRYNDCQGPRGFGTYGFERFLKTCSHVSINAGYLLNKEAYIQAAKLAAYERRNVVIVETEDDFVRRWLQFFRRYARDVPVELEFEPPGIDEEVDED